jgi:hypothetical protein
MMGVKIMIIAMSEVHNFPRLESTLKKISNSVCYHGAVREAVASGEYLVGDISTPENPADTSNNQKPRDNLASKKLRRWTHVTGTAPLPCKIL